MLRSKMIYDPNNSWKPNKLGATVGLVFYTPKFWDCHEHDFYVSQFDDMYWDRGRGLSEDMMEERYLRKRAHRDCKRKHMSYKGYMYWIGPKRRYEFRYMGALNSYTQKWWKPFSVTKHGKYTRWFDNGPKAPEKDRSWMNDPDTREMIKLVDDRFSAALAKSRAAMSEYERIRERR